MARTRCSRGGAREGSEDAAICTPTYSSLFAFLNRRFDLVTGLLLVLLRPARRGRHLPRGELELDERVFERSVFGPSLPTCARVRRRRRGTLIRAALPALSPFRGAPACSAAVTDKDSEGALLCAALAEALVGHAPGCSTARGPRRRGPGRDEVWLAGAARRLAEEAHGEPGPLDDALNVFRSSKHIYAQVIDDDAGRTPPQFTGRHRPEESTGEDELISSAKRANGWQVAADAARRRTLTSST